MATILQRLKDQLKDMGEDTAGIQTISQALKKMVPLEGVEDGVFQKVTGDTISECLDNLMIMPRDNNPDPDPDPLPPGEDHVE